MEQQDQRNLLIALGLMMALIFLYNMFVLEPQRVVAQKAASAKAAVAASTAPAPGQPVIAAILPRADVIATETAAGQRVAIDAPAVNGSISLKGGRIDDVSLKNFYETLADKEARRTDGEIKLLSPEGTDRAFFGTVAWASGAGASSTDSAVWTQTNRGALTPDNPLKLSFASASAQINRTIAIDNDYLFTVTDVVTNTSTEAITLVQSASVRQRMLPEHTTTPYGETGAHRGALGTYGAEKNQMINYHDLSQGKSVKKDATGGWNALTTKYWMAAAIPDQAEPVEMVADSDKSNGQMTFRAGYVLSPYTIQPGQSLTKSARIFAGAKRVSVLEAYEKGAKISSFTDAVDWGWLFFITRPFFFLLQMFQGWFGSFGLAILTLTVVVKTVFFPLQLNMYKSMSKMRLLQPEMKSLQERFGADPQRMRQEQAKLWQREKINPLAGCLPLIPTMFVFYALFQTLNVTIEMRHTPFFGWIHDMSAPDPTTIFNLFGLLPFNPAQIPLIGFIFAPGGFLHLGVFPLLYGGTMVMLQSLSAPPADKMQRQIMRWVPLIFMFLFAGFASGLVIYYVWSNFISVVQQYIIMRRTGVETEVDKWIKKRLEKKPAA